MLEGLDSVSWESRPQPDWNDPRAVPDAIRKLAAARSEDSARQAYDTFLYSIGNNHAGTYYPVVLDTVPFLGQLLQSDNSWARSAVLDVLVDLLGSFEPQPGHETVETVSLRTLLRRTTNVLSPDLLQLAGDGSAGRSQKLASEVMELLADAP